MVGSIVFVLLGAAAAATPCESLVGLKLDKAIITAATMVPEGPAPARAGGPARGGAPAAAPAAPARPPATIPAHCRVQIVLKPSADSLINMEMWLPPAGQWNGKFMGVGNGGFAGSI